MLLIIVLCVSAMGTAQQCPNLLSPVNGATNVAVDTAISWESVAGVPGYRIRLGLTPGGAEILERSVGNSTSYTPPLGLPENTQIHVTIILDFLFNGGPDIVCSGQSFRTEDVTTPPGCTTIRNPADGAINVSVFTNIVWNYAPTATDYSIRLGTTPGGSDILSPTLTGNVLSYNPPGQLPSNTTIHVTIFPRNENGSASGCAGTSFTTGAVASIPGCTSLIDPLNGATNVPLTPLLEWFPVPGATGYRVTIGSTPNAADILDNTAFPTNSTFVLEFEPNRTFFIRIVPFNSAGDAIGCGQESFSTLLGCGPYLDTTTGEFISLNPEITFPDTISLCSNELPHTVSATDVADGYRWFKIDIFGNESLISDTANVELNENGTYRYEAYTNIAQSGQLIECPTTKTFTVVSSELATINNLDIQDSGLNLQVTVDASGGGDYEYAVDNINGPYQNSNVFNGIEPGTHTFYVRDKNGCGIVEETFSQDLTVEGFPKFFTPNGDSVNDFWQFIQPQNSETVVFQSIRIFDRYGMLLKEISQNSLGWDGNFSGRPLPSGNYWFSAVDGTNREIKGYFALKR
ncbi:T9SS type B sorting domain-containing protein [Flagellimonas sp. S3867]|uniref:T9SS type B sorting domain-containing protein n=1 Tax=Flagellimonas sp. S3867 TaxID=2768063 RepID=UPI00168573B9|nr:T9SS type B sorting domain-containing protein [Flagellimonas sp. S3867]